MARRLFHLAHVLAHGGLLAGWRVRRAWFVGRLRLLAAWHRADVELAVSPDLVVGRGVRLSVHPGASARVDIGPACRLGDRVRIELAGGALCLGPGVDIRFDTVLHVKGRLTFEGPALLSQGCTVHCDEAVTIGSHAALGEYVTVADSSHRHDGPADWFLHHVDTAPVVIGRRVWIAAKATVTRGTTLGDASVVGAGSTVCRDVAPGDVVSGVPAQPVRPALRSTAWASAAGDPGPHC